MLWESDLTVALVGAGLSTASGIPDFRGKDGLWATFDPVVACRADGVSENRPETRKMLGSMLGAIAGRRPNPGHVALASLCRDGLVSLVVTQNVDGLETLAGCENVIHVHGTGRTARCHLCGQNVPVDPSLPPCPSCGGPTRPDMVLFGERLPEGAFEKAREKAAACDLLLCLGTSCAVGPANGLSAVARTAGARVVTVTMGPCMADAFSTLVIKDKLETFLPAAARAAADWLS